MTKSSEQLAEGEEAFVDAPVETLGSTWQAATSALEALAEGVTVQGADGKLLFANQAAAALCGFASPEGLVAATADEIASRFALFDDRGAPLSLADLPGRRVLAGLDVPQRLLRFVTRGGSARWAWVTARPWRPTHAGPLFVINSFRDATESVESQQQTRAMLLQAPVAIAVLNGPDHVYELTNPRYLALVGRTGGLDGRPIRDVFPEAAGQGIFEALDRVYATGEPFAAREAPVSFDRGHGVELGHFDFTLTPLRDGAGQITGVIAVALDVTEQVRARQAAEDLAAKHEAEQASQRMQQTLAGITDAFAVLDARWRYVFANAAAVAGLGKPPADVLGHCVWDLVPELRSTRFFSELDRASRAREAVSFEEYYEPAQQWIEVHAYPVNDGGLAVYSRDITARKREESLRARLAQYATLRADVGEVLASERDIRPMLQRCCERIVQHLPLAFARVWLVDAEEQTLLLEASAGLYTHIDGGHARVPVGAYKIGRIAAERKAHLTNDVLHDDRVSNKVWAASESMVSFAGYPLLVDGKLVGVLAGFSRERLADDMLAALGGVSESIAHGVQRRRAEIELADRADDLARSNEELERFAYVASHDLQEPLRMVASYNQLLARRYQGKLDADADEFIGFAVDGAKRMQRLINDLLAYSRVGRRGVELAAVDMARVFDHATANLRAAITEANAVVTHDPLPTVVGDEGQLLQVLQNLIGNAVKFRGEASPVVHVRAERDRQQWRISVIDNGIGIDPQYFDRIFIIFQRLHTRERYPGTGIGLAICKKIVESHGGRMSVQSEPGRGATISFTIPVRPMPPAPARRPGVV